MALTWRLLTEESERDAAWSSVVESCGYATFFHTPAWARLFATTLGSWEPDPVVVEFSDGNVAVLPMSRRIDSEHRQSVVPGMYGGPLFLRPPTDDHWEEFDKTPLWYEDILIVDNPYAPHRWDPNGLVSWRFHTHIADLSAGFESAWKAARENVRRNVRKAERSGIEIRLATGVDGAAEYFDVYESALDRFGDNLMSLYPKALFENLVSLPEHGSEVQLTLAYRDGRAVSGLVMLYWGDTAMAWHYSTRPEELRSNACPLLLHHAMKHAAERGTRWFDFLVSGPLTGVAHFKEGFGARPTRYRLYWSPGLTSDRTRPDAGPGAAFHRRQTLSEAGASPSGEPER